MLEIAVIGAGIAGLSCAVNVQIELPQAQVSIIADKFDDDTTSSGAGGYFRPNMQDIEKGVDPKAAEQWVRDSWEYYHGLAQSELAAETGQSLVHGLTVTNTPEDKNYALLKKLAADFRQVSSTQLQQMNLERYKYGYAYTTVVTQPRFLTWLMSKFKTAGGKVEKRTVNNVKELCGSYDIVVNCCGLRANEIVEDTTCYPIKGHLVLVHAPWQKQFFFAGNTYLIPHDDKLLIGGLRDKDNNSLSIDSDVRDEIMSHATELFPQLKGARILREWVGLRPYRQSGVRLELEHIICEQGKKLAIVHNYGHGGHGITLGWGCGKHAARLAKIAANSIKARL